MLAGPAGMIGTATVIFVSDHDPGATLAVIKPNLTLPGFVPKYIPVMVTESPGAPVLVEPVLVKAVWMDGGEVCAAIP